MNNPLISVIMPAYNAENTIKNSILSIPNNDDVEIIVVVDGAKDKTEQICRNIRIQYNNLKIMVQENQGQYIARKNGIRNAIGKYIMFLDADDMYYDGTIDEMKKLISKYEEPDLIRFRYEQGQVIQEKYTEQEEKISKNDFKTKVYPLFIEGYMLNSLGLNCVKKEILDSLEIGKNDIRMGEDLMLNLKIFTEIQNVVFSDKILYKYMLGQQSVTNTKSIDKWLKYLEDSICVYSKFYEYLADWGMLNKENIEMVNYRIKRITTRTIAKISNLYHNRDILEGLPKNNIKEDIEKIKQEKILDKHRKRRL